MRSQRLLSLLLGPLVLLVLAGFMAGAQSPVGQNATTALEPILEAPGNNPRFAKNLRTTALVEAVNRVKGAVVNIHSERTVQSPSSQDLFNLPNASNQVNGMGTGIVIDPRGYIVTNNHVVEEVNVIKARLADGTTTMATVLVRSRDVDLALLKINLAKPLPTMPLGTAKDLMVGEEVFAIGNAFGYEHTVTRGIVSQIKRDVSLNKEISYKSLIQTDASINPGNSGGPLINIYGDLVGVNVAIRAGAQGIGFAIPVDTMISAVSDMMRSIRLPGASDGMLYYDEVNPDEQGPNRKVIVEKVLPKGAAEEAGLQQGDVLTRVADQFVQCSYDVDRALLGKKVGDKVSVAVQRQGKPLTISLELKQASYGKPGSADLVWKKLGIQLVPVSKDIVTQVNPQLNGGMRVATLSSSGLAAQAGIRQGDILVGLHQWETLSLDNIAFVLLHPDLGNFNPLSFYLIRNGQVRRGWIQNVE